MVENEIPTVVNLNRLSDEWIEELIKSLNDVVMDYAKLEAATRRMAEPSPFKKTRKR